MCLFVNRRSLYITCTMVCALLSAFFFLIGYSGAAHALTVDRRDPTQPLPPDYDFYNRAGGRVSSIQDPSNLQQWHTPDKVTASWQVPCIQSGSRVGAVYDMWIGLEGTDGSLIQVGVRGWIHGYTTSPVLEYWGWAINTKNPNAINPLHRLFIVDNCGLDAENPVIQASVDKSWQVSITAAPLQNGSQGGFSGTIGPTMTNVRYADYVIERLPSTAQSGSPVANFGIAKFIECRAFFNGNESGVPGSSNTKSSVLDMHGFYNLVLVHTDPFDQYGNLTLHWLRSTGI